MIVVHLFLSYATFHFGDGEIPLVWTIYSFVFSDGQKLGECMGETSDLFTLLCPSLSLISTKMEKQYLVRTVRIPSYQFCKLSEKKLSLIDIRNHSGVHYNLYRHWSIFFWQKQK